MGGGRDHAIRRATLRPWCDGLWEVKEGAPQEDHRRLKKHLPRLLPTLIDAPRLREARLAMGPARPAPQPPSPTSPSTAEQAIYGGWSPMGTRGPGRGAHSAWGMREVGPGDTSGDMWRLGVRTACWPGTGPCGVGGQEKSPLDPAPCTGHSLSDELDGVLVLHPALDEGQRHEDRSPGETAGLGRPASTSTPCPQQAA